METQRFIQEVRVAVLDADSHIKGGVNYPNGDSPEKVSAKKKVLVTKFTELFEEFSSRKSAIEENSEKFDERHKLKKETVCMPLR